MADQRYFTVCDLLNAVSLPRHKSSGFSAIECGSAGREGAYLLFRLESPVLAVSERFRR
jgi:hypothetical protein